MLKFVFKESRQSKASTLTSSTYRQGGCYVRKICFEENVSHVHSHDNDDWMYGWVWLSRDRYQWGFRTNWRCAPSIGADCFFCARRGGDLGISLSHTYGIPEITKKWEKGAGNQYCSKSDQNLSALFNFPVRWQRLEKSKTTETNRDLLCLNIPSKSGVEMSEDAW